MRKVLFIAAIALLGLGKVSAQERDKGDIEVYPFIGYSSSFFNGDEAETSDARTAVTFGVNGDYFFNDRWSLRSGLNYNSMGADNGFSEFALDYLSIPMNANWHFGSTRKWNLNFGLTPGFLLSADLDGLDVKEQVESFQLGISYGIGYKLEVSENFSILFDAQGLVGVTNIYSEGNGFSNQNAGSSFNIGGVFKL
jgi:hypothetical protein